MLGIKRWAAPLLIFYPFLAHIFQQGPPEQAAADTEEATHDSANEVTVENIKSDQIRLKCDKSGNWDPRAVDLKVPVFALHLGTHKYT